MWKWKIKHSLWVLSWSVATLAPAMPNLGGLLDQLTGKLPVVESITVQQQQEIMQHFLYPAPRPLQDAQGRHLPVVGLLVHHLREAHNTQVLPVQLLQHYAPLINDPFRVKTFVSKRDSLKNLRMGPKTSYYFYLGMIALVRDIQPDALQQYPFSAEEPFPLKKTLKLWAIDGFQHSVQTPGVLETKTIYPKLVKHRAEYYELFAYRFLEKNSRLDGWGPVYLGPSPEGSLGRYLGDCKDTWKKVRAELAAYRSRLGQEGDDFAHRVAVLTQASLSTLLPVLASPPRSPVPSKPQHESPNSVFYDLEDEHTALLGGGATHEDEDDDSRAKRL